MIVLKRQKKDCITNKTTTQKITCSGFVPLRVCTKISPETRAYLHRKKVFWIETLLKLEEIELKTFSTKFSSEIEIWWRKLRKKTFLNEQSQEILRYLNHGNVRLTIYDRNMIVALSNFSFLYKKQDLHWILAELFPHLFNPSFVSHKRDKSKGMKIREAFEYTSEVAKKKTAA